jgi:uncharacterized damage-inducible protein DinB
MNTLIEANLSCLQQGIELLNNLSGDIYRRKCATVFGSTIGGHFRHNIDHYLAFKDGFTERRVDYDARQRQLAIEEDSGIANEAMTELIHFFMEIGDDDLDLPMEIRMDDGGDSTWSKTSLRRELQFLLSHTIHHYALVVSIASRYGIERFPEGFGVAPSTLHFRQKLGA